MTLKIPVKPPDFEELFDTVTPEKISRVFQAGVKASPEGVYRHWDDLRGRTPPEGLSLKEWWFAIKWTRLNAAHSLPFNSTDGHPFSFWMPDGAWERVHKIDQGAGGRIACDEPFLGSHTRDQYMIKSLMEEAITSSQLEGASTTAQVAKEMIRSGRPPRDVDEQMILNNYHAMHFIRERQHEELTPEFICELHKIVTDKTLKNPRDAGRMQSPGEVRAKVFWRPTGEVLHIPPPAEELPQRLEALCRFANGEEFDGFLHPVIRSIIVHFWLPHDHPFVDGNGRTARALFYWCMLKYGYWLAEHLSISTILKNAPSRYTRSFLLTETDDGDVTYFIIYQLKVLLQAIEHLEQYVQRKVAEIKETESLMKHSADFNHRQLALLSHALRHPDALYTVASHRSSHNISEQTARTDLQKLENRDLLVRGVFGKAHYFLPPPDLSERLRAPEEVA